MEETHCFMAACMYLEVQRSLPGFEWTKQALDQEIDELNKAVQGNARVGSWRRRAIANLVLWMPQAVFDMFQDHYRKYTWERSCLNEEILQHQCWRPGHALPKAKGPWTKVFTVTESTTVLVASALIAAWEKLWPKPRVREATLQDIQSTRITSSAPGDASEAGPSRWACMACLLNNWAAPLAEAEFGPEACQQLRELWLGQDASLLEDLDRLLPVRVDASSFDLLSLSSMAATYGHLAKAKGPAPGGATAAERLQVAQDCVKRWESTKENILRDQAGSRFRLHLLVLVGRCA